MRMINMREKFPKFGDVSRHPLYCDKVLCDTQGVIEDIYGTRESIIDGVFDVVLRAVVDDREDLKRLGFTHRHLLT